LEEYVNAGYPVKQYAEFCEKEASYREQRLRQAKEALEQQIPQAFAKDD
jgi:hypothetical protein